MPDIFETPTENPTTAPITLLAQANTPVVNTTRQVKDVTFQKQDPDETIILLLRRHVITNVSWILGVTFLTLVPIVILPFLGVSFITDLIPARFLPTTLATYYLIVILYTLVRFLNWYYNILIVTQKRIVDIDFSDVIYHDVAITKVEEVEDVHYTQTGFLSTIFNYGNVFIQTQADKANFEALSIPNPAEVSNTIVQLTGDRKGGKDD